MITALEELERIAKRVGWRLIWKTEPDVHRPTLVYRSLDIVCRGAPVLIDGPRWVHCPETQEANASERIAAVILQALPKRSGGLRQAA
jgi:hypothetical protein